MPKSKAQLASDIKAAGGEDLNPDDFTAAEQEAKLSELQQEADEGEPALTVKVNPDKGSGSYLHPASKQAITRGEQAVTVPDDAWTQDMVARRFLLEVRK